MSLTFFKSILFPVDFSAMSNDIAGQVRGLAQLTGGTITLVHVIPWLSAWNGVSELRPAILGQEILHQIKDQQSKALDEFRHKWFGDITTKSIVRDGAVAETIVDVANEINADLILMPTRGQGKVRPFLIGSTTAKVLHDATCPVWTDAHNSTDLPAFSNIDRLLCVVDPQELNVDYLKTVAQIAHLFNADIDILSVLSEEQPPETNVSDTLTSKIAKQLNELNPDLAYRIHVERGSIGEAVHRIAAQEGCDLVVANRGHLQQRFGKIRTRTFEIILNSPCPVLSLSAAAQNGEPSNENSPKSANIDTLKVR
jgi:nucleotide-binding universal stress UspA family protein